MLSSQLVYVSYIFVVFDLQVVTARLACGWFTFSTVGFLVVLVFHGHTCLYSWLLSFLLRLVVTLDYGKQLILGAGYLGQI